MARLGGKRIHLLITDSRGAGLGDLVCRSGKLTEHFEVKVCRGATLGQMVNIATKHLQGCPFDVVYLAGGACDITTKDDFTKQIYFNWGKGGELKNHLVGLLKKVDADLKRHLPASRVVYCTLIGSDLKRVVNAHPTTEEQQQEVNEAVWDFNCEVFKLNKERGSFAPSLHNQVHRVCNGKKRNYYQHLHDGLHPTEDIITKWADQFIKAIAHN